jgi:hypothetical protein
MKALSRKRLTTGMEKESSSSEADKWLNKMDMLRMGKEWALGKEYTYYTHSCAIR